MKQKIKNLLIGWLVLVALTSCVNNTTNVQNNNVLSAEEQALLTPDKVIEILKKGNQEFITNNLTIKNNTERARNAINGQYPEAVILSCMDSRVPVEDIFHCGLGDICVVRVTGNIVNPDILGSMEYACKIAGAKLVVVLGHGHCGAIKSAIDDFELGNITGLLDKIKPAIYHSKENFAGETKSSNPAFIEEVCLANVKMMVNDIRVNSPILKEMENDGEIKIVGAIYEMESGKVEFY